MTKEQEAIERLKSIDETVEEYDGNILKTDIETVFSIIKGKNEEIAKKDKRLNRQSKLLNKKDKEIGKKDKIIDLMAEQLAGLTIWNNEKEEPLILTDKEDVIKYFKEIAERKSEEC